MNRIRSWPALDIHPMSDLLQEALLDCEVAGVHERSADNWRVFFESPAQRDCAASALRERFPELSVEAVDVADEDWAARSQASLRAIRVGTITVCPPWDRLEASSDTAHITIVIQPSMGFGTGHHATTRLCLAALQRLDLRGRSVIDAGTGSGVLAIAASLQGAERVTGLDDDGDAIAAARENLALNPEAQVAFAVSDLRTTDLDPADVVVANLTGGLLEAAAPQLRRLVAEGGCLILSGFTTDDEGGVLASFSSSNVEHRMEEDGWLCVTLGVRS